LNCSSYRLDRYMQFVFFVITILRKTFFSLNTIHFWHPKLIHSTSAGMHLLAQTFRLLFPHIPFPVPQPSSWSTYPKTNMIHTDCNNQFVSSFISRDWPNNPTQVLLFSIPFPLLTYHTLLFLSVDKFHCILLPQWIITYLHLHLYVNPVLYSTHPSALNLKSPFVNFNANICPFPLNNLS